MATAHDAGRPGKAASPRSYIYTHAAVPDCYFSCPISLARPRTSGGAIGLAVALNTRRIFFSREIGQ